MLGDSRTAKAAGHKVGAAILMGGNKHETSDKSLAFRLDGQEILLMYGYRFSANVLPYFSFSSSTYKFKGELTSPYPELDGKEPAYTTSVKGYNIGAEGSHMAFFGKVEISYQQLETTDTSSKTAFNFGFAAGVGW